MAVVSLLKSRMSRDPLLMPMLRCLAFYAAYYSFQITVPLDFIKYELVYQTLLEPPLQSSPMF